MEVKNLTISKVHQGLINKEFSAFELAQGFFEKIQLKDPEIFSYLTLNKEQALSQAKEVDEMIAKKEEISLLAGVPCAVKDNILLKDLRCTAGSKILENYIAPYDATVVEKLKKEKAVILGKTNMDEFAMGSSNEYSAFGVTKNPLDLERVPGGSSGGSAAAVAGDLAIFSLGSDTGGSIRQPASFCGIVGLKPTYGAVSRYGLIAMASSLDQIGPLAKNIEDVETVFNAIKGRDKMDSTSVDFLGRNEDLELKDLVIGLPKEYFIKGVDREVDKIIKESIKKFENQGAKIEEISLPNCTDYSLAAYYIIMPSEASSNLARYDGIKYGFSVKDAKDLMETYFNSREQGFGEEVRRRIMLGAFALSSGYYDAYYLRAQKVRTLIREDFQKAFKKVKIILTPTAPTLPFKIGEKTKDPLSMYLSDIFVTAVNLAGLPGISLPAGSIGNFSVGLHLIGKPFEEKNLLKIGKIFEKIR
ncbi:MAG: Asp-tRNA(Asn)/Glu-tRNA(Gln) amidotransferase subunit GatA [Candidatus Nealsonbacteria bacterium]|nr:Asp-tRNA(Asn)/Glu-tRNA(Gln) amidotransferase subunit GatA [Candidatus Nealsonbacteria bacterium]